MDSIYNRRSCRKYTDEVISREDINAVIKAGMHAPSAHNQQPARYIVIENRDILNEIAEFHPYAKMLTSAAFAILVCFDKSVLKSPGFVQQDCSAATQNMLTKATDMGIGSAWIGVYPNKVFIDTLHSLLSMDEQHVPFALVSFGMPAFMRLSHNRFEESWVRYM